MKRILILLATIALGLGDPPQNEPGSVFAPTEDSPATPPTTPTPPTVVDGEFSTYIFDYVSDETWDRLAGMGVKRSFFVTEWDFLAPGGAEMIRGVSKDQRYLLGLTPYDLDLLQAKILEVATLAQEFPEIWDPLICLNYEDPLPHLWWLGDNEQAKEDAFALYARVMGRAMSVLDLEGDVKLGGWGAAMCGRGNKQPVPWRVAAGRLGSCLHLTGYMRNEGAPEWDWLHAQIEAGLAAGFDPADIRVWIAPYGIEDRIQFGTPELVEIGRILGEYGVGAVYYDDRLFRDMGVQWGEVPEPAVQKAFDARVMRSISALIRGMNEGAGGGKE